MLQIIGRLILFLERPYRDQLSPDAQCLLSQIEAAGKDGLGLTMTNSGGASSHRANVELRSYDLIKIVAGRMQTNLRVRERRRTALVAR